jgi:hypothetical protein
VLTHSSDDSQVRLPLDISQHVVFDQKMFYLIRAHGLSHSARALAVCVCVSIYTGMCVCAAHAWDAGGFAVLVLSARALAVVNPLTRA